MHIHILGVCGTFMGGIAQLAQAMGYSVSGSDQNVYPPMSTQLQQAGIELLSGYSAENLQMCNNGKGADLVVIGNALSRGNPAVEAVLNQGMAYISGPQWLSEYVLKDRWVLAVAGTHGKTTTASMLAWILDQAGLQPGFLIGGVANDFGISARLGQSPFFVVEADEYDTAFFDKRSKFVHYRPRTLVLNNLEFDHADIFPDLAAIARQFQHLLRIVPAEGRIILPANDDNLAEVLQQGCWTPQERFAITDDGDRSEWQARSINVDGSRYEVICANKTVGMVDWSLLGQHNTLNGLAALAAARHVGVTPEIGIEALSRFAGVKRRLEVRGEVAGVTVYDDFAHHPTAIATTLAGLRHKVGAERIIAVLEPRSNTMRMGVHNARLLPSLQAADQVCFYQADGVQLSVDTDERVVVFTSLETLLQHLQEIVCQGDHILIMSNGGFGGLHAKLLAALQD